jgi:DNA-binding GntR family transcriptional regulator
LTVGPLDDVFAGIPALQRTSTTDQTANGIRELILSGRLPPGTPLTEVRLAGAFGVSRNTVREALLLLAQEGIVTQHRHRGATVTTLTVSDIRQLCQARLLLEEAAVQAGETTDLSALEHALVDLEEAVNRDDLHSIPKADVQFHRALVGLLKNGRLEGFYAQLETELRYATLLATRWDALNGQSIVDEHRGVYELLRHGKRRECRKMLRQILADTERYLLDHFEADDGAQAV